MTWVMMSIGLLFMCAAGWAVRKVDESPMAIVFAIYAGGGGVAMFIVPALALFRQYFTS